MANHLSRGTEPAKLILEINSPWLADTKWQQRRMLFKRLRSIFYGAHVEIDFSNDGFERHGWESCTLTVYVVCHKKLRDRLIGALTRIIESICLLNTLAEEDIKEAAYEKTVSRDTDHRSWTAIRQITSEAEETPEPDPVVPPDTTGGHGEDSS